MAPAMHNLSVEGGVEHTTPPPQLARIRMTLQLATRSLFAALLPLVLAVAGPSKANAQPAPIQPQDPYDSDDDDVDDTAPQPGDPGAYQPEPQPEQQVAPPTQAPTAQPPAPPVSPPPPQAQPQPQIAPQPAPQS